MKFYLIPYESITLCTLESKEEIFASLSQKLNYRIGGTTELIIPGDSNCFEIQRKLNNRSRTLIIAKGAIFTEAEREIIIMDVTAKDNYVIVFAIFWYSINFLVFLLLLYASIRDQQLSFSVFLPLFFIFLGYGFSTTMMQGGIDNLINEVKTAIKEIGK